jgi:hypothetical protein
VWKIQIDFSRNIYTIESKQNQLKKKQLKLDVLKFIKKNIQKKNSFRIASKPELT